MPERREDVLLKLVTSAWARNALVHFLDSVDDEEEDENGFGLFFLSFDARMASDREYRVFCRSGDDAGGGEAAHERVVRRVREAAEEVRGLILAEVAKGVTKEKEHALLLEQGFFFDLFYDEETDACSLVELNTFGVRSACGSCLFQWVEGREVLYGEEEAQFRVSVDMGPGPGAAAWGPDDNRERFAVGHNEGPNDSGSFDFRGTD
ncbi:uncharacterized protein B0T15DRAFT_562857 [Chaetomium strumarium]|uniref:Cell division cycle protein 123 n=1 Tax=Chaetomium strumarium TaxID=1170767 RepID=A0AAJ0GMR2_9PEZI|nr:hypothetical protein B0T15DRAFT_562857 [Chaetomium strumarium]